MMLQQVKENFDTTSQAISTNLKKLRSANAYKI